MSRNLLRFTCWYCVSAGLGMVPEDDSSVILSWFFAWQDWQVIDDPLLQNETVFQGGHMADMKREDDVDDDSDYNGGDDDDKRNVMMCTRMIIEPFFHVQATDACIFYLVFIII